RPRPRDLQSFPTRRSSDLWRERDMKQKLHVALEELTLTKKVVDEQNKNIRDSINYASRIQDAIIPKYDELKEKFADIFIYHKAKDRKSTRLNSSHVKISYA